MKINKQKAKKDFIRAGIFIGIVVFMFTLPLLFNYIGPWIQMPHENGPYLSFGSDASTNIVISYETPQNVSTTLYWGTNMNNLNIRTTTNIALHAHNLTNLEPNTLYYYKINSSQITTRYMNKFYSFKTGFNQTNPGAFKFAVYGDNQVGTFGTSEHQRIVDRVITHNPDFVINTGDTVSSSEMHNWDRFFYEVRNLISYKPYMISIGNHEQIEGTNPDYGKHFKELYNFPHEEVYYSFNYSNACFIALNISVNEHRITLAERAWLINTLTRANSSPYIDWIFVYFHVPPYSSGGHGCNQHIIEDYVQIFKEYHVDIVFTGHDHQYERSYVDEIYYFVNGGGGGALDFFMPWYGSRTWSQIKLLCYHYLIIDINGDYLHLQAIRSDGLIFDQIYLESKR
ncbi:MAG: metallophosphoesterase family protein [Candidatus Lokiarchaeota archaeon]|nr:metallophosphoesterase family protein [Candidatus Lokiarchaeota archaeon]